jgi:hypothetical protein
MTRFLGREIEKSKIKNFLPKKNSEYIRQNPAWGFCATGCPSEV